ncbi:MAG: hypothetical protein IKY44_03350 [Clostridia bacterium]|nr:hypothetical protein [Clostridia bacterium]
MSVLQDYKCPCCDGAVEFDSSVQKMKCPYCDSEFDVAAMQAEQDEIDNFKQQEMNWDVQAGGQWQEGEQEGLRVYTCDSCGGEVVADETTGATECPYCGNPVVMKGHFSGALKPDYVIPFKLDKNAAIEALKKHYMGKRLLPKVFQDQNHIEEVKGVYVPFWLFDTDADANIRYEGTKVRTWSTSRYNYTETRYYSVVRAGSIGFNNVPVDGSTKMADDLMESIEPFDVSQAVPFNGAYLAGYMADKYDVDAQQSIERANDRIKRSTENEFAATAKSEYLSLIPKYTNISLNNGAAKYALYPVWILNTTWNGQKFTFAMNGQTGKLVGDLPMDKGAYRKWLFGLTAAVGAVAFGISYLLWLL